MKRILMMTAALLAAVCGAWADGVSVADLTVPQGGQATLDIGILFDSGTAYTACQFDLSLPDGVSTLKDADGLPAVMGGDALAGHDITPNALSSGDDRFVVVSFNKTPFSGSGGTLLTVTLCADRSLNVGERLTCAVRNITFTTTGTEDIPLPDVTFTVTVGESRTLLDELSTAYPVAEENANVRVRRTIAAGEWSTLCLPFSMTGEQVKAAFGADVELADFAGYEVREDADGDIACIDVAFDPVNIDGGIAANHPCLIRVSADVSEFTVDGVDIDPDDEPVVATVKRTRKQWSEMRGTYVAGTEVPEKTLFLSGSQFWYSVGATRMKAFRAYFDFYDVLTEVDEAYAKVRFSVGGAPTAIAGLSAGRGMGDGTLYTLSGQRVGKADGMKPLRRGLYIVNGKKVLNP